MKRADLDKRAQRDKFGAGKHGFQSGNPTGGVLPTIPGADWFDHVQEEVANVIEAAKYTIDPNKYNQLLTAINQLIANVFETREEKSIDEVSESLMQDCIVSYPHGEKTGAVQAPVKVFNIVGKTGSHWRHQLHFRAYSTEVYIKSQQSINSKTWIIKRLDGADWSDVRGKPTTVAASGLTDAATKTEVSNAATAVKNEILGGAGAAFDTLKELAAALQNKSDKEHTHRAAEISDFAEAVAALTVHQKIGTFDICKLPDGTQIESGTVRIQNHNNNPTARVLTWPLAFITAPVVVATLSAPEGDVRDIWVTIDSRQSNKSAVYYWLHEPVYNTPDVTVNFVAIGRWK